MGHGFQYTRYRADERNSQETVAFTATITRNGRKVGTVANAGRGGAHEVQFADRDDADGFEAAAVAAYPGEESQHLAFEMFSAELEVRAEVTAYFRRKRSWIVQMPGEDAIGEGAYRQGPSRKDTRVLVALAERFPEAEVFDRDSETFVPVGRLAETG